MLRHAFVLLSALTASTALGAAPKDIQTLTSASPAPLYAGPSAAPLPGYADMERRVAFDRDSRFDRDRDRDFSRDFGHDWGRDRDSWRRRDRSNFDFDFDVNFRHGSPAPSYPPPVVITGPRDVRPYDVSFTAIQAGQTIILTAQGRNTSGGFTTSLDLAGFAEGKPVVRLLNYAPRHTECGTSAITPFAVSGYVNSCEPVCSITVMVGCEEVRVPVQAVGALR